MEAFLRKTPNPGLHYHDLSSPLQSLPASGTSLELRLANSGVPLASAPLPLAPVHSEQWETKTAHHF